MAKDYWHKTDDSSLSLAWVAWAQSSCHTQWCFRGSKPKITTLVPCIREVVESHQLYCWPAAANCSACSDCFISQDSWQALLLLSALPTARRSLDVGTCKANPVKQLQVGTIYFRCLSSGSQIMLWEAEKLQPCPLLVFEEIEDVRSWNALLMCCLEPQDKKDLCYSFINLLLTTVSIAVQLLSCHSL